jgi:hypothetical protein
MWNLRFSSGSFPELVGENGLQIAKIGIRNLSVICTFIHRDERRTQTAMK